MKSLLEETEGYSQCITFVKRVQGRLSSEAVTKIYFEKIMFATTSKIVFFSFCFLESFPSQVLMCQIHPENPLQSILVHIRHNFGPLAKLKADVEENAGNTQKRRGGGSNVFLFLAFPRKFSPHDFFF